MARVLPQIESLTLKKEELAQLDIVIGSIPAAYSLGLIDIIRLANHNRNIEQQKISTPPPYPKVNGDEDTAKEKSN